MKWDAAELQAPSYCRGRPSKKVWKNENVRWLTGNFASFQIININLVLDRKDLKTRVGEQFEFAKIVCALLILLEPSVCLQAVKFHVHMPYSQTNDVGSLTRSFMSIKPRPARQREILCCYALCCECITPQSTSSHSIFTATPNSILKSHFPNQVAAEIQFISSLIWSLFTCICLFVWNESAQSLFSKIMEIIQHWSVSDIWSTRNSIILNDLQQSVAIHRTFETPWSWKFCPWNNWRFASNRVGWLFANVQHKTFPI